MAVDWGLATIISSAIIGTPIAIWKVIYPMWLRSIKIKLDVHSCWYKIYPGVPNKSNRLRIFAFVSVEQQRGENIQIKRFWWKGCNEQGPGKPAIGVAPKDGSGIEYGLNLSDGHWTKRVLEWEVNRDS